MGIDVNGIKQGQRMMWAAGDFAEVAKRIQTTADLLAEDVGAGPGVEVLDVATGSGNVAMAAARSGAHVKGLDLTPELLEVARRRASDEGFEIEFVEGDAENLPYAEGSFDGVTSCFGVMFAPLHEKAAAELVRVARPGATIAVAAWTPDGLLGRMFRTIGSYMPAPPEGFQPPVMWGQEEHVRSLFAGSGGKLAFHLRTARFEAESVESWIDYNERNLGPTVMAKAALEPQGRYGELRAELVAVYSEANEATDGTMLAGGDYLVTTVKLPAD